MCANYNYNPSNQLTSNSVGSYTYDANGNTLTDAQGWSFTWNFENRLTQAVVPGQNSGTTTFKYDPFRRRIQKSGPMGTTNYLYDGPNSARSAVSFVYGYTVRSTSSSLRKFSVAGESPWCGRDRYRESTP